MTRDEREQLIWHDAYMLAMSQDPHPTEASGWADAAVAEFRKRYPPQAQAPPAVWYDEPPFAKDGVVQPCWMQGEDHPVLVARACDRWEYRTIEGPRWKPLADRRVSHIIKPPEPTT